MKRHLVFGFFLNLHKKMGLDLDALNECYVNWLAGCN
jgi:hypothetical protein